jgi:hypothetical protein
MGSYDENPGSSLADTSMGPPSSGVPFDDMHPATIKEHARMTAKNTFFMTYYRAVPIYNHSV